MLGTINMTREDSKFDEHDFTLLASTARELPYVKAWHRDPLRSFSYVQLLRKGMFDFLDKPTSLVDLLALRLNQGVRRTYVHSGLIEKRRKDANEKSALFKIISEIHKDSHHPLSRAQSATLKSKIENIPLKLQSTAAAILLSAKPASLAALSEMNRFSPDIRNATLDFFFWNYEMAKSEEEIKLPAGTEDLLYSFNYRKIFGSGMDLFEATNRVETELHENTPNWTGSFDWDTPIGRISLHGSSADIYPASTPYLLLIDIGGNDTYYSGANAFGTKNPVSVLIDVGGNDRYLGNPELAETPIAAWKSRIKTKATSPLFGSGVFGFGFLLDSEGNDFYRSADEAFGQATFGMGVLKDRAGNDRYDCYADCLGSGAAGIGMLLDQNGQDEYFSFTQSQGFGQPQGAGLLLDGGSGNDTYLANDAVRDLPFKRGSAHNVSMSQGAGTGWRGDLTDGRSLAGGLGFLVDGGGNNSYTGGIFSQGVGYWHGLGVLSSGKGNDRYLGDYYGQGASAHFAVGVLHDEGGDDFYKSTEYQAMGQGRDVGNGVLFDEAGSDIYEAPLLSLGFGDLGGVGLFWDKSGDDVYRSETADVVGSVRMEDSERLTLRSRMRTLGLFLDSGGEDRYETARSELRSGSRWTKYIRSPIPGQIGSRGVAFDINAPETEVPR